MCKAPVPTFSGPAFDSSGNAEICTVVVYRCTWSLNLVLCAKAPFPVNMRTRPVAHSAQCILVRIFAHSYTWVHLDVHCAISCACALKQVLRKPPAKCSSVWALEGILPGGHSWHFSPDAHFYACALMHITAHAPCWIVPGCVLTPRTCAQSNWRR